MPTYFDTIPIDILRQKLFPFLQYDERDTINSCLTTNDRIMTRIESEKIIQFEMMLSIDPLRKGLQQIESLFGENRKESLYKYLNDILPANMIIPQYNRTFRNCLIQRIAFFSDMNNADYNDCTDDFKINMAAACSNLQTLLDTRYPYICEKSVPNHLWSPISNSSFLIAEKQAYSNIITVIEGVDHKYNILLSSPDVPLKYAKNKYPYSKPRRRRRHRRNSAYYDRD